MAAIHQQIAAAERHSQAIARCANRHERFMSAIDWQQMTGSEALDALELGTSIGHDLASAQRWLAYLHQMEALGYSSCLDQVPYDPSMPFCMGYPLN
ncbi:hypothetical protein [Sphingomonas sp. 3-13AW]|uniref:hypothetical protein n=1 Tax=Sphingomonas sp. 3-13AW TaxID=3050450 RepID=UPI003BB5BF06